MAGETLKSVLEFFQTDAGIDGNSLRDNETLFSSGLVDSLVLIELLAFIEFEFGFIVSIAELQLEDLDTISNIVAFVERGGSSIG